MFGKRRLLVLSLLAFGARFGASPRSAARSRSSSLGRVMQGFGGGIFPLCFGIIRDEFPREQVASSIGLISAIFGIGGGAGLIAGGLIADHLSYHWIFWLGTISAGAGRDRDRSCGCRSRPSARPAASTCAAPRCSASAS